MINDKKETPKRGRKIRWNMLALVLVLVGSGMLIVGFASGSRGGSISFSRHGLRVERSAHEDYTFTASGDITDIIVNAVAARVSIEYAPHLQSATVQLVNLPSDVISLQDGNLTVDARSYERQPGGWFTIDMGVRNIRREIIISLPQSVDTVNISSTSGSVGVDGITASESVTATSTSGRVTVNNVSAVEISAVSTSGSVNTENLLGEELTARTTSGAIRGENLQFTDIYARSVSGAIRINNTEWRNLQANTTSGAVRIYGQIDTEYGASETSLRSVSGAARLELRNYLQEFDFSVNSLSGTARVYEGGTRFGSTSIGWAGVRPPNDIITINTTSGSARLYFQ